MTFEQWIEIAKVISPVIVGLLPSFWIVRELNLIHRELRIVSQDLKDIVKSIHDLDIRIVKLEPKENA